MLLNVTNVKLVTYNTSLVFWFPDGRSIARLLSLCYYAKMTASGGLFLAMKESHLGKQPVS
jgi:hypothetical protein